MRRLRKTRAVEPVIAALLLIAIAVAAAVVTYSWVMGMISSQQAQAGTGIRIDLVEFKTSTTGFNLTSTVTLKTDLTLSARCILKKDTIILAGSTINGTAFSGTYPADRPVLSGSIIKAGSTIQKYSNVTSDKIEITIRNSGSVIGIIATIYVKTPEGDQWKQDWTSNNVITPAQTWKFVFTTLNTVTGSSGAAVGDTTNVPFGWSKSSSYTIKIITDNGFVSELAQTSPSTHT